MRCYHRAMNGTTPEPEGGSSGTGGSVVWYPVPAAARYWGISERAVRKRIEAGSIQAQRDGTRWLVAVPQGTGTTTAKPETVEEPGGNAVAEEQEVPFSGSRNRRFRQAVVPTDNTEQTIALVERSIAQAIEPLMVELREVRSQLTERAETVGTLQARLAIAERQVIPGWGFITGILVSFIFGIVVAVIILAVLPGRY